MAAIWSRRCPLCAKSRHSQDAHRCPLYPQKRTLGLSRAMSAMCQKLTHAVQQLVSLLDNVVRAAEQRRRKNDFGIADIDLSQTIKVGTHNKIGALPSPRARPRPSPPSPGHPDEVGADIIKNELLPSVSWQTQSLTNCSSLAVGCARLLARFDRS